MATEVLDGLKIHKKYIHILGIKSEIYLRKKQYDEAFAAVEDMQK